MAVWPGTKVGICPRTRVGRIGQALELAATPPAGDVGTSATPTAVRVKFPLLVTENV